MLFDKKDFIFVPKLYFIINTFINLLKIRTMEEQFNYESNVADLKSQFEDYEKEKEQKSAKQKREEILEKIFLPRKTKEIFRILPPKKGRRFYEVAYFHSIEVNDGSGGKKWAKIYCPKHNDPRVPATDKNGKPIIQENGQPILVAPPCPLCDRQEEILSKQDNSIAYKRRDELDEGGKLIYDRNKEIFKEANKYKAKKFFIIKGISRMASIDGPKFWRFNDNYLNRGVMDKLKPILQDYLDRYQKDFMSPIDGTDLAITVGDARTPAGRSFKDITSIQTREPSPLHEDVYVAKSWLEDNSTWRDVFKPRKAPNITPYQYLEMLAKGIDPYFDDTNKKWVFPGNLELEELANKREGVLPSKQKEESASDLSYEESNVNISNIKKEDVGEFKDDSIEVGKDLRADVPKPQETIKQKPEVSDDNLLDYDDDDLDDLPF